MTKLSCFFLSLALNKRVAFFVVIESEFSLLENINGVLKQSGQEYV
jgi:hypothetical protein